MKRRVTLLFLRKDDQILLAMKKRGFGAGLWNGVGGKTEPRETVAQAVARECREEIGVTVEPADITLAGRIRYLMPDDPAFEHDCFIYTTERWQGEPRETEEMRPEWFNVKDIPYKQMWPADQLWLPHLIAGEPFEGTINASEREVVSHDIAIVPKAGTSKTGQIKKHAPLGSAGAKTSGETISQPVQRHRQSNVTFDEMSLRIWEHLKARDWHTNPPRGIATSIALEAGELLEHYQWADEPIGTTDELADELADVLIYAFQFAQALDIDIAAAMEHKLAKAAQKYPAEKFKGKTRSEMHTAWIDAKIHHRKEGL